MRSSSRSPKSRTQFVRLSAPKGVNNVSPINARIPDGFLADAQNVRLSKGAPEPRPGLRRRYDVTTALGDDLPVTGIGAWRFPADEENLADHQILLFGQKDGAGALYADRGVGIVDVTPTESDGVTSSLAGAGLDAHFAELNYKTFMVNGKDGIVLYNGNLSIERASQAVVALPQLPYPTVVASHGSLAPEGGWQTGDFVSSSPSLLAMFREQGDFLHPLSSSVAVAEGIAVSTYTGVSQGAMLTYYYDDPLVVSGDDFKSDELYVAYNCDVDLFIPLRMHIGVMDQTDQTTNPNSGFFNPDHALNVHFDLPVGRSDERTFAQLPWSGVPDGIKAGISYIAFEVRNTSLTGRSTSARDDWTFVLEGLFLDGYLDSGTTHYRVVPFNSKVDVNGPASEMASIECYAGLDGQQPATTFVIKDLVRRTKITVDFTNVSASVDEIHVYRALHEPAEAELALEGFQWYKVATALRTAAVTDGSGNVLAVVYDNLPEAELKVDPLQQLPFDESPTAFNDEAPWYIASTGTRILYARTKSHPGRVYASEVGKGSAVPNIDIDDYDLDETPHGGFSDVTHDTGGTITGLFTRMNDTLVFLDSDLIIWTRANEFTVDEKWQFTPISAPGCIASRSICRIVGGVVYAGADGIYFLPDNSYQVVSVPLSEAVRGYFDDVPNAARDTIACDYDPVNRLLLVALPEPGETKPSCLAVYDTSSREWQGKWKADGSGFQPGIVFTDYQPSTGQHVVYLPDAATGTVWTVRDPETDPTPYGDGDTAEDVECSVTSRFLELDGYKSKIVRRRLEFTYDEQVETDDPLTLSNVSLTIKSRPGGVKEFAYPDVDTDPSVEGNGLIEYGNSGDGLERVDGAQGLEHQAIVAWSNDGGNAKPIRFLGLSLSLVPAGRYH
jgi:hypothetical protein